MKFPLLIVGIVVGTLHAQPTIRLDIQTDIGSLKGQTLVKVLVKDVVNLDTYTFDVRYDTARCAIKFADIQAPALGIDNCLQDGSRSILPVVKKEPGVVHISATVTGQDPTGAVQGEGVIGVLEFSPKNGAAVAPVLEKVILLDNKRNRIAGVTVLNASGGAGSSK
jgi:hypothetical protein